SSLSAPQPMSSPLCQMVQKVTSGLRSSSKSRAWLLSGGDTSRIAAKCSASNAAISGPVRSSILIFNSGMSSFGVVNTRAFYRIELSIQLLDEIQHVSVQVSNSELPCVVKRVVNMLDEIDTGALTMNGSCHLTRLENLV